MGLDVGLSGLYEPSGKGLAEEFLVEPGDVLIGSFGSDPASAKSGAEDHAFFERETEERELRRTHGHDCRPVWNGRGGDRSSHVIGMCHLGVEQVFGAFRPGEKGRPERLGAGANTELMNDGPGVAAVIAR